MDRLSGEKALSMCYLIAILSGGIASITTGIVWGHWYKTLDQCINRNCSCILYGQYTPSIFLGGEQAPCIWTVFGPLLYVFFAVGLVCFHGYRVLFATKSPTTRSSRAILARTERDETVRIQTINQELTSLLPACYWITAMVFSLICTLYGIVHFGIFANGYYHTCNEYRKALERMLGLHGSVLPVVHSRLTCQSIFDFMDYMQIDSGQGYRNGIINTGLALAFGLAGSLVGWIAYFFSAVLNFKLYRLSGEE